LTPEERGEYLTRLITAGDGACYGSWCCPLAPTLPPEEPCPDHAPDTIPEVLAALGLEWLPGRATQLHKEDPRRLQMGAHG
jgi:hypothetical protein